MNQKNMACANWRPGDRCALATDGVDDFCVLGPCSREVPSEGDLLRSYSDKQLAAWLADHPLRTRFNPENMIHRAWLAFLQQPATECSVKWVEEENES